MSSSRAIRTATVIAVSILATFTGGCEQPKVWVPLGLQEVYETQYEVWNRATPNGVRGNTVKGDDYYNHRVTFNGEVIMEYTHTENDYYGNIIGGRKYLFAHRQKFDGRQDTPTDLIVRIDRFGNEIICLDISRYQDPRMMLRVETIQGNEATIEKSVNHQYHQVQVTLEGCPEPAKVVPKKPNKPWAAPPHHSKDG